MRTPGCWSGLVWAAVATLLTACSNGRGSVEEPQAEPSQNAYSIGGAVTGLTGSGLVLHNNRGDALPITADGQFTFQGLLAAGATYSVAVAAQPTNPTQTCTVANGAGSVDEADVTDVLVTCATGELTIGGEVTGLVGAGLVLQNNGRDDLTINQNGQFIFSEKLAPGAVYSVTVKTQPVSPAQNCTVRNASGTLADASVTNIVVACTSDGFTVGGAVSGLAGSGLELELNGAHRLSIVSNGPFAFEQALTDGSAYTVAVARQPRDPTQQCTVANSQGAIAGANVVNIAITCSTSAFQIGGSVSGLAGAGLSLRLNDAETLAIHSNGTFTFSMQLSSGSPYSVAIASQPSDPAQSCTISNASGEVGGSDVSNVRVVCSSNTFSVGGSVSNLLGSGLVLQNNGGDDLAVRSNGPFTFSRELADGASYQVTVRTQPSDPAQTCTVTRGSGLVAGRDVADVAVTCSTSDFTIGGSVRDLSGSGLVLLNNGSDALTIDASGPFTFGAPLPTGAVYNVTIATQPADPAQTCEVENGAGVVVNRNIEDVLVRCTSTNFRIRGRVSDLRGSGLVLQNNGADDLAIASNGRFTFSTPLPSGAPYNVTVAHQPSDPTQECTVRDGAGTVESSDVEDVEVRCDDIDDDD